MNIYFVLQLSGLLPICAPEVSTETMAAVVQVESGWNPLAIGVVGARLKTPPATLEEAVFFSEQLEELGKTFSVGIAQINRKNLPRLGLTYEQAFEPCTNLQAASKILVSCYARARKQASTEQEALEDALSCYYSGNFERGYQRGPKGEPSYVEKVRAAVRLPGTYTVPSFSSINEQQRFSWPQGAYPGASVPVAVQAVSVPQPAAEEAPLLVSPSVCRGVVLGSPCSSSSAPTAPSIPPSPAPATAPSIVTQERKEAPATKPTAVF